MKKVMPYCEVKALERGGEEGEEGVRERGEEETMTVEEKDGSISGVKDDHVILYWYLPS